jgi:ubiquinone/menaquinone biosynthesis C-methylase UbiE
MTHNNSHLKICDYEGSQYRTEFWETSNRAYEDAVERVAISHFLPPFGNRLIEIGAGYGRLADLYTGYQQVILLDYARTQLLEAQRYLGNDPKFIYVIGNVYQLPFVANTFDSITMIRVMHHLSDVPDALTEIHRILTPNGVAVIEHASKLNLKAILRYMIGQQQWNPFTPDPIEFIELNYNFHPAQIRRMFQQAGLRVQNTRTLSHFRINLLKRLLPTSLLVTLDSQAQKTGNLWQLTPSVCLQATAEKQPEPPSSGLFRCPNCHSGHLAIERQLADQTRLITCHHCNYIWQLKDGIYDFKTPYSVPSA